MRHNQNARRMRGGSNGGGRSGGHNGGGGNHNGGSHHNNSSSGRRVNPRVQTFDSNGPDVRIRGTAYQINEKYVTLARDATSAGDRVLAESYLQHAEHYQRFINEMTEEFNQYQQQNPQAQPQPVQVDGNGGAPVVGTAEADGLNDLDQGFLVGPRHGNGAVHNGAAHHNGSATQHNGSGNGAHHNGSAGASQPVALDGAAGEAAAPAEAQPARSSRQGGRRGGSESEAV